MFSLDGWHAIGTGLSRINPPDVITLDLLETEQVNKVLDEVKYGAKHYSISYKLTTSSAPKLWYIVSPHPTINGTLHT